KKQIVVDELEKLNIPILKLNDMIWFLKPKRSLRMAIRGNDFLSNLCNRLDIVYEHMTLISASIHEFD
ncbi:MAG: hypothetical protein WB612_05610, partial [Nitrososphaeraceae archaeon]